MVATLIKYCKTLLSLDLFLTKLNLVENFEKKIFLTVIFCDAIGTHKKYLELPLQLKQLVGIYKSNNTE